MLKLFSIIGLLVVLCTSAFAFWLCRQALPVMDGIVSLPDLERQVKVRFDQSGIPYIQAASRLDLGLAQGYITASERMFQMDVMRRMANGQMSEVFGSACLAQDKLVRTIGFARLAKGELSTLSPETRAQLKAYCLGVNSYINRNSNRLPIEFLILGYRPHSWQPEDSLAVLKFLQYELDESWRLDEFRNRVIDKGGAKLASLMFEQNLKQSQLKSGSISFTTLLPYLTTSLKQSNLSFGSNGWAVAGGISNSGGSLLACDKHSQFSAPDLWYFCSLSAPALHTAGATIPGVPGIIMGRNENIAWAMTALKADVQDLFIEQFSEKYPLKYRIPGGWSDAEQITEEIPQRFASNLLEKIILTRHGPLLLKNETSAVALSWTGFHSKSSALETIFELNRVGDWSEFRKILRTYDGSPQSFLYADRFGNIGSQIAGNIPVRNCDHKSNNYLASEGSLVLPGWNDSCAWENSLKFEELPSKLNSADGFLVANDPRVPFISTGASNIAAQRVVSVLSSYKKSAQRPDLPEMSALQGDESACLNNLVKVEITAALKQSQTADKFQTQAIAALDKWNGQLNASSAPAAIYQSFLSTYLRRVLEPRIGRDLANEYVQRWPRWSLFVARALKEKPPEILPPGEKSHTTFTLTTFGESLKNLRMATNTEKSEDWTWQKLHKVDFLECTKNFGFASTLAPLLLPGSIGVGGDQNCVNACNVEISRAPWLYQSTCGPTERIVIDMADQDKFYQNLTLGQSGHLCSNNRIDQLRSWLNIEPHAMAFSEKQVQLQMQHTLVLSNTYQ